MIITILGTFFMIYDDAIIITILSKSVMWCNKNYNTNDMIIKILGTFVIIYDATNITILMPWL